MRDLKIERILKNYLGHDIKYTTKDNIAFKTCPFCGNNRYNFEVNINPSSAKFGYWHCWVCDTGGRKITNIFKRLNYDFEIINEINKEIYNNEIEINNVEIDEVYKILSINKEKIIIPKYYKRITEKNKFYYNYITKIRNLKKKSINMFNIYFYKDNILIPNYNDNMELSGYVVRNIDRNYSNYYLYSDNYKNLIFFENLIVFSLSIVLVEGVFDAMTLLENGIQAIPLLGKKIYPKSRLFNNILYYTPEITIFLDKNEKKASKNIALKFIENNYLGKIYITEIPNNCKYKDINEMGYQRAKKILAKRKEIFLHDIIL